MLRRALLAAADSAALERWATRSRPVRAVALRYVAGESLDDAAALIGELAASGRTATLDHLGEALTDRAAVESAVDAVVAGVARIRADRLPAGVSVKPTQVGLAVDEGLARASVRRIAAATDAAGVHLTLDMEDHTVTEATVRLVEDLRARGHHDVGCAVQSALRRTDDDLVRLTAAGASVRLCKGAYAEPASVAHQRRADIDASFRRGATYLLRHGRYPRFATHDDRLLAHVLRTAVGLGVGAEDFELQMLHGVRPSLQTWLVARGCRVCVYVPYGAAWYRYFVRRLGERPANLAFFLRSLRDT